MNPFAAGAAPRHKRRAALDLEESDSVAGASPDKRERKRPLAESFPSKGVLRRWAQIDCPAGGGGSPVQQGQPVRKLAFEAFVCVACYPLISHTVQKPPEKLDSEGEDHVASAIGSPPFHVPG
jgi:hypothetical protein